ncbi:MAG: TetR family transcriptional regulator [Mycobacteriaceae bacterium]|nr:TetR family transcriptional regulator [Mycobacteriaceae bacterium]
MGADDPQRPWPVTAAPSPEELTVQQRRRRLRILEVGLAMAEDGYEAVNMRVVAERAGVAMGTLYRYFPGKEHLLVCALGHLLRDFTASLPPHLVDIDNPYTRVWHTIQRLFDAMSRRRLLADAVARAYVFADASVGPEVENVRLQMVEMFADVMGDGAPVERDHQIGELLTDVLASNLPALAHNRRSSAELRRRIVVTLGLLEKRQRGAAR